MSQTEIHFGKLKRVETDLSIENWCKEISIEWCLQKPEWYKSYKEFIISEMGNKYFFVDDQIWEAIEHTEIEEGEDLDIMTKNEDGTISFVNSFYNGGTCLSEVIEDGLKRILYEINPGTPSQD